MVELQRIDAAHSCAESPLGCGDHRLLENARIVRIVDKHDVRSLWEVRVADARQVPVGPRFDVGPHPVRRHQAHVPRVGSTDRRKIEQQSQEHDGLAGPGPTDDQVPGGELGDQVFLQVIEQARGQALLIVGQREDPGRIDVRQRDPGVSFSTDRWKAHTARQSGGQRLGASGESVEVEVPHPTRELVFADFEEHHRIA